MRTNEEALAEYAELKDLWIVLWLAIHNASTIVRGKRKISKKREAQTLTACATTIHKHDRYKSLAARSMVRTLAVHSDPRAVFISFNNKVQEIENPKF